MVKVIKDTMALIENASSYIHPKRSNFVDSIDGAHPRLASFLWKVTKEDVEDTDSDLFGPKIWTDLADTIEAFN